MYVVLFSSCFRGKRSCHVASQMAVLCLLLCHLKDKDGTSLTVLTGRMWKHNIKINILKLV